MTSNPAKSLQFKAPGKSQTQMPRTGFAGELFQAIFG